MGSTEWAAPSFAQPFQGVQFQQGNDAQFVAVVSGIPTPEVSWLRKGQPLISSVDKYQVTYDPASGRVSLIIRDLGPGDEGQYSCVLRNAYGKTTATLSVNPDVNRMRHRGLSPGCCRATIQKRLRQRHQQMMQNGGTNGGGSIDSGTLGSEHSHGHSHNGMTL